MRRRGLRRERRSKSKVERQRLMAAQEAERRRKLNELAVARDRETAKVYAANPAYASFLVNKELASKVQIAVLPLGTDCGVLGNIIQGAIGSGKK